MNVEQLTPSYTPLVMTVFAIICIATIYFLYKKNFLQRMNMRRMEIIEKLPVDKKNTLIIVRAGNKNLLIGASSNGLNMLTDIEEEKAFKFEPRIIVNEEKVIEFPFNTNLGA